MAKAPEKISLYDIILSVEGTVETAEIRGIPAEEIKQELFMLEKEYRSVNNILKQAFMESTLAKILEK